MDQDSKTHDHYSAKVQRLLAAFDRLYHHSTSSRVSGHHEAKARAEVLQGAWNSLLAARKKETGIAAYLDKDEYSQAVKTLQSKEK
jgi:hypothetical protein